MNQLNIVTLLQITFGQIFIMVIDDEAIDIHNQFLTNTRHEHFIEIGYIFDLKYSLLINDDSLLPRRIEKHYFLVCTGLSSRFEDRIVESIILSSHLVDSTDLKYDA